MNPVRKRIWELARFELGPRKKFIKRVCRREIIVNRRYAWRLYSDINDSDPVETVILDVSLAEALAIDRDVGAEVDRSVTSQYSQLRDNPASSREG